VECLTREIKILQSVQHPNIVRLYDVSRTDNYIYIFLELCNDGDLATFMKNRPHKRLSEIDAVGFFKQIAEGFKAL
jgi:serine/threonine-protein kinase ULK2